MVPARLRVRALQRGLAAVQGCQALRQQRPPPLDLLLGPFPHRRGGDTHPACPYVKTLFQLVKPHLPLVGGKFPLIRDSFPIVGGKFPLIRDSFPLIGDLFPPIRDLVPLIGGLLPPFDRSFPLLDLRLPFQQPGLMLLSGQFTLVILR